MSEIIARVNRGDSTLKELKIKIEGASINDLITSLKSAKDLTNEYLTTLVNAEKSDSNTRKIEELASSDEEEKCEDKIKKQKTETG